MNISHPYRPLRLWHRVHSPHQESLMQRPDIEPPGESIGQCAELSRGMARESERRIGQW